MTLTSGSPCLLPATYGLESEDGPLWHTIRKQLYKSEVSHVKRLVGESLIHQNRLMWDEVASLRQILTEYAKRNDELDQGVKQQVQLCGTQHRDLLRRQAQIVLEDVKSQGAASGQTLEDLLPGSENKRFFDFILRRFDPPPRSCNVDLCSLTSRPVTPSTRPSSASGVRSGCSTPDGGMPRLPLGRALGLDEISVVAEGIRDALEAEHDNLMAEISDQMQRFEFEDVRRIETVGRTTREPSTQELQQFVHKLQELAVSPALRTLSIVGPPSPTGASASASKEEMACPSIPTRGGSHLRRLQALIADRRRITPDSFGTLGVVSEAPDAMAAAKAPSGVSANSKPKFDPFFDDPAFSQLVFDLG